MSIYSRFVANGKCRSILLLKVNILKQRLMDSKMQEEILQTHRQVERKQVNFRRR